MSLDPKKGMNESRARLQSLTVKTTTNQARHVDIVTDSNLNFNIHIKKMIKSASCHIESISTMKIIVSAGFDHVFIFRRLEYCNCFCAGLFKVDQYSLGLRLLVYIIKH